MLPEYRLKLAVSITKLARTLLTAVECRTIVDRLDCRENFPPSNVTLLVSMADTSAASPAAASVCGLTTDSLWLILSATSTTASPTHSAMRQRDAVTDGRLRPPPPSRCRHQVTSLILIADRSLCPLKPGPHQQQCRSNIVECYNVECCFDKVELDETAFQTHRCPDTQLNS